MFDEDNYTDWEPATFARAGDTRTRIPARGLRDGRVFAQKYATGHNGQKTTEHHPKTAMAWADGCPRALALAPGSHASTATAAVNSTVPTTTSTDSDRCIAC
jgi:hypothetical protein